MQEQENIMTLSRSQITDAVFEKLGKDFPSKAAADRIVAAVFDEIVDAIAAGKRVQIDKLGSFSVVETAARKGRNPSDGTPIDIPAGVRVKYHASKPMRAAASAAPKC